MASESHAPSGSTSAGRSARRARRRLAVGGALVLPAFGWTALFFIAPLIILIAYSFGQIDIITVQRQVGLDDVQLRQVFQSLYLSAIGRSLLLSTGATLACLLVGFPVAYYISLQQRPPPADAAAGDHRPVLD